MFQWYQYVSCLSLSLYLKMHKCLHCTTSAIQDKSKQLELSPPQVTMLLYKFRPCVVCIISMVYSEFGLLISLSQLNLVKNNWQYINNFIALHIAFDLFALQYFGVVQPHECWHSLMKVSQIVVHQRRERDFCQWKPRHHVMFLWGCWRCVPWQHCSRHDIRSAVCFMNKPNPARDAVSRQ